MDVRSLPKELESIEELQQRIEGFTHQNSACVKERQELYGKLAQAGELRFLLGATVHAQDTHLFPAISKAQEREEKWYRKEWDNIEKLQQQIREHDLVRSFSAEIDFYEPEEVDCPHGRRTKRCLSLHYKVIVLHGLRQLPPPFGAKLRKRIHDLGEELRRVGVDPSEQTPENFCGPNFEENIFPSLKPHAKPGRPGISRRRRYLLEAVIPHLDDAGVSLSKSCNYLFDILRYCFGEEYDASTIQRTWRRLKKKLDAP